MLKRLSKFVYSFCLRCVALLLPRIVCHVIGDSHTRGYRLAAEKYPWYRTSFKYCTVDGASALGILNPRSKTNAMDVFSDYTINNVSSGDRVVICLGEVDCGFVIWYRSEKYQDSIANQLERSLQGYTELVMLIRQHTRHVFIASTPLPTIPDSLPVGAIAHARAEVATPILERTKLTIEYNHRLREIAKSAHSIFLDFERETLDSTTGIVRSDFLNDDPSDHHLNPTAIAPIIRLKLKKEWIF